MTISARMLSALIPAALAVLVAGITQTVWAAPAASTQSVRVVGTAPIVDENTSGAKDQAVAAALIAAVETALLSEMPGKLLVSNFSAVSALVHDNTDRFIQGYRVLAEARLNSTYKVMLDATVSTARIRSGLVQAGIVVDPENRYKLLLMVSENNFDDLTPQYWWGGGMSHVKTVSDTTLTQHLAKKGFEVLAHRKISVPAVSTERPGDVLSREQALALARSAGADVFVTGTALAEQAANTMGDARTFTGLVTLTVYRSDTGERIGSVLQKAVTVHDDEGQGGREAIAEAARLAADDLAAAVTTAMKEEENKPTMIEVVIGGADFLMNYPGLSRKIASLTGVKRVKQRERQKDTATIVVDYVGNGKTLAKALMAETFDTFGLSISEVRRDHLRLDMVSTAGNIMTP
ncbi:hypothetical protein JCM14469_34020 [Desulfatiferula olefinivorans]